GGGGGQQEPNPSAPPRTGGDRSMMPSDQPIGGGGGPQQPHPFAPRRERIGPTPRAVAAPPPLRPWERGEPRCPFLPPSFFGCGPKRTSFPPGAIDCWTTPHKNGQS